MEYVCHTITLNLLDEKYSFALKAKRGDTAVKLKIYLKENVYPYTISKDCYAVLIGTKTDGTILYNHCDIEDNAVVYTFTEQTVSTFGPVACAVKLYGPDHALITSTTFRIDVEGVMYAEHVVESKDEVSALTHLVSDTTAMLQEGRSYVSQSKEVLENAQLAVKDAQAALEDASRATEAANTAADRANAASDIAYEANRKVDTLREVVSQLHSNIVCTSEGKIITISDSAEAPLQGLKLFGRTEQRKTTGKNLLNLLDKEVTYSGVRFVIKNGVVTVAGTVVDNIFTAWLLGSYTNTEAIFTLPAGTYTATGCSLHSYDGINRLVRTGTFNLTEPFAVTAALYKQYAIGTVINETAYPQIELGSTATAYEPYTGGIPSPNPEYPQALESVGDDGIVTTTVYGKNLFDGVLENGYKDSFDGVLNSSNGIFQTMTFFIPKEGIYTISFETGVRIIRRDGVTPNIDCTEYVRNFETGNHYISFRNQTSTKWDNTIKIQLEQGEKATEYEPYTATTATATPVDSSGNSLHLPGIPVADRGNYTDETGQQWICDEVDFAKGVYVQRVKRFQAASAAGGALNQTGTAWIGAIANDANALTPASNAQQGIALCSHLPLITNAEQYNGTKINGISVTTDNRVFITVQGLTTLEDLNGWLAENEVYAAYALAKPIENVLPENTLAAYAALRTNYPNTTVYNDAGAHMEVKYVADTKLYVDQKFAELAQALVSST